MAAVCFDKNRRLQFLLKLPVLSLMIPGSFTGSFFFEAQVLPQFLPQLLPVKSHIVIYDCCLLFLQTSVYAPSDYRSAASPLDTNVVTCGIHKCARKHLHIANIQMLGRKVILRNHRRICSFCETVGQTLMLIEQLHHIIHRFHRICQFFCLAAASKSRQDLGCRR